MIKLITGMVIAGVIAGGIATGIIKEQKIVYEAQNEPVDVIEEEVEALPDEWIEEAEKAKQAVIERKKLEQREAELNAQIDELQTELVDVEKELGTF